MHMRTDYLSAHVCTDKYKILGINLVDTTLADTTRLQAGFPACRRVVSSKIS